MKQIDFEFEKSKRGRKATFYRFKSSEISNVRMPVAMLLFAK